MLATLDLSEAQAYALIIGAIVAAISSLGGLAVSIINALQSRQNGKTLDVVKVQGDGTSLAAKKSVAISAENLALVTNSDFHKQLAAEAKDAYEAQEKVQEKSDAITKPSP